MTAGAVPPASKIAWRPRFSWSVSIWLAVIGMAGLVLLIPAVFLLTGIGTLLNVLSGRLARIIDRARILEQRLEAPESLRAAAIVNELNVLENRGRLIYHAIKLSTASALLVCFLIAALSATSMLHYSTRVVISGLFIAAMLASIVSLTLFLREVYLAIETFEIGLPAEAREDATERLHAADAKVDRSVSTRGIRE